MKASNEQLKALNSTVRRLLVRAFAGAGKTYLLELLSQANPKARILYVAYSQAVEQEASGKFPSHVECRTTHSLAWSFGRPFKQAGKLADLRPSDLMKAFNLEVGFARVLLSTVENFMFSGDAEFAEHHVPNSISAQDVPTVIQWGRHVWAAMRDLERKDVPMPHDGYLKLYQLSKPDLSRNFDIILLDEYQDLNPVTVALIKAQKCRVVMAGDDYQSIFAFRGAVNARELIEPEEVVYLTESRRFGPGIAKLATMLLTTFRGEHLPVRSAFPERETGYTVDRSKPYAIIGRTNARLFANAVSLLGQKRLHFVGGIENYPFGKLVDVYHLMVKQPGLVKDSLLRTFGTFAKLEHYAGQAEDKEILSLIGVVKRYGDRVPELVKRIKEEAVDKDHAEVSLMTAHRSKGLEFDQVVLLDDFEDFITDAGEPRELDTPELVQELHLLYVAVTRAQRVLELNAQMRNIVAVLSLRDPELSSFQSAGDTVQGGEGLGLLPGFDYLPSIDTRDVSNVQGKQPAALFAPKRVVAGDAELESMVEHAILRQGMLQVARLAQVVGVHKDEMADIIVRMIRKGALSDVLFIGSPEIALRLKVKVAA